MIEVTENGVVKNVVVLACQDCEKLKAERDEARDIVAAMATNLLDDDGALLPWLRDRYPWLAAPVLKGGGG